MGSIDSQNKKSELEEVEDLFFCIFVPVKQFKNQSVNIQQDENSKTRISCLIRGSFFSGM